MNADMIDPAELEGYNRWLETHLDEVCRQYPGRFIAVYRDEVVAQLATRSKTSIKSRGTKACLIFRSSWRCRQPKKWLPHYPPVFYPGS